jgi:hypothetical protein
MRLAAPGPETSLVAASCKRERHGSRSTERPRELDEDRQVGVQPIQFTDASGRAPTRS